MVDTIDVYGHMIEFYEPTKALTNIHDFIREASVDFDGTDPLREFAL